MPPRPWIASRPALALAVALPVALGVLILARLPREVFWITDGGNRFLQVESFDRAGAGDPEILWPGRALDPELRFFPWGGHHFLRRGARVLSFYPPYFPLLALPGYRWLGLAGLHLLPLLGYAATLLAFAALLGELGLARWRAPATLGLALGTPLLFYGLTFWEHTLAVALGLAAVVLLVRGLDSLPPVFGPFAAGVLLGLSTALREEGYVFFAALALAGLLTRRRLVTLAPFALGWAAALAPFWWLQARLYGGPLGAHAAAYEGLAAGRGPAGRLLGDVGDLAFYLLRFHPDLTLNALLALPFVLVLAAGLRRRAEVSRWDLAALGLATAAAAAFVVLLLRRPEPVFDTLWTQGLLPHIPFLLLALLALRSQLASPRPAVRFLAAAVWLYALFVAVPLHRADVGIVWGPRHFLPVIPLLAALALLAFRDLGAACPDASRRRLRLLGGLAAVLFLLGLAVEAHGLRLLALKERGTAEILAAVRDTPSRVVVTDAYWLPEELAALWFDKAFFFVGSDAEYRDLLALLARRGVGEATVVLSRRYGSLTAPSLLDLRSRAVAAQPVATPGLGFLDVMVLRCRMR